MGHRPTHRGHRAPTPYVPYGTRPDSDIPAIKRVHNSTIRVNKIRNREQWAWASGKRLASIKPKPVQPCAEFRGRFHRRNGALCCGYVHYKNVCYRVVGGIKSLLPCKHQE